MAKNTRKAPVKIATKPITDFFTRKPSASDVAASQSLVNSFPSKNKLSKNDSSTSSALHGSSILSSPSIPNVPKFVTTKPPSKCSSKSVNPSIPPRRSLRLSEGPSHVLPVNNSALKRSRSPDQPLGVPSRSHSERLLSTPPTSPARPKSKVDHDSDREASEAVIYGKQAASTEPISRVERTGSCSKEHEACSSTTPGCNSSRKKPRLSADVSLHKLSNELIPSSQSDEEDLIPSHIEAVSNDGFNQRLAPSPGNTVDVDYDSAMDTSGDFSVALPDNSTVSTSQASSLNGEPTIPASGSIPTPPLTEHSSDGTPGSLKTSIAAKRIENALAKAKAAASDDSDNESSPVLFKEVLDDSDEDLFDPSNLLTGIDKSSNVSAPSRASRYSLRARVGSSSTKSLSSSAVSARQMPSTLASSKTSEKKGSAGKKLFHPFNPLDALLKEKNLADRRGKGERAIEAAESAVSKFGKNSLMEEMEEEDFEDRPNTSRKGQENIFGNRSNGNINESSIDDVYLAEEDRKRLFGDEGGKGIMSILQSDREKKAKDKENEKIVGVPLWKDFPDAMNVDGNDTLPSFSYTGSQPILNCLKATLASGDYSKVALLLSSGILTTAETANDQNAISLLCCLALSTKNVGVYESAFRALLQIWGQGYQEGSGLSFNVMLSTISNLGANPSALRSMEWDINSSVGLIIPGKREDVLYRLVALCHSSASLLAPKELPDIVSALILVAVDPSCSPELQQEIMLAINKIFKHPKQSDGGIKETELAICTKLLRWAVNCTPINKANFLSLLAAGSGRTRRIAQWIAHSMLTNRGNILADDYSDLPSLSSLLDELNRYTSPGSPETPGVLEVHENTEYVDMGFYIYILSIALSDVKGYVQEERRSSQTSSSNMPPDSPSKSGYEKPETELQLVRTALENLHSKITDIRAAHLDRSRAKAAVKGLSMRIHYQREAFLRSHGTGNSKPRANLRQYFPSKG